MSMYPDEQSIEIDGEIVNYPGLVNGKFSSGDPNNLAVKPSFIPAETINLIVDNIAKVVELCGYQPNNTSINQLWNAISKVTTKNADGTVSVISHTDLNDLVISGIYQGNGLTSAPIVSDLENPYFFVEVFSSIGTVYQRATLVSLNSLPSSLQSWQRKKRQNAWLGWTKIWSADNDGINSGLDADLFNGLALNRFLRRENDGSYESINGTDLNNLTTSGSFFITSPLNAPESGKDVFVEVFKKDSNLIYQRVINQYLASIPNIANFDAPKIWHRLKYNGTWKNWVQFWDTASDGNGIRPAPKPSENNGIGNFFLYRSINDNPSLPSQAALPNFGTYAYIIWRTIDGGSRQFFGDKLYVGVKAGGTTLFFESGNWQIEGICWRVG